MPFSFLITFNGKVSEYRFLIIHALHASEREAKSELWPDLVLENLTWTIETDYPVAFCLARPGYLQSSGSVTF